jgi:small basic protein
MLILSESYTLALAQQCLDFRMAEYFVLRETGDVTSIEAAMLSVFGALRTLEDHRFSSEVFVRHAQLQLSLAQLANWLRIELAPRTAFL